MEAGAGVGVGSAGRMLLTGCWVGGATTGKTTGRGLVSLTIGAVYRAGLARRLPLTLSRESPGGPKPGMSMSIVNVSTAGAGALGGDGGVVFTAATTGGICEVAVDAPLVWPFVVAGF